MVNTSHVAADTTSISVYCCAGATTSTSTLFVLYTRYADGATTPIREPYSRPAPFSATNDEQQNSMNENRGSARKDV